MRDKGTLVVPDILANAGSVTVSYFEWVQNRSGVSWDLTEVQGRLRETMSHGFNAVYELAQECQIDLRTAAYVHGLTRIGAAIESQGTHAFFGMDQRPAVRPLERGTELSPGSGSELATS